MKKPQDIQKPRNEKTICALIITHNPDQKVVKLLNSILEQVSETMIIDNGTKNPTRAVFDEINRMPGANLIENSRNLGIATALNQGLKWAVARGFEWMITFDQDSQPEGDLVEQLSSIQNASNGKNDIAIIAPQIIDAQVEKQALFLRRRFPFIYERVGCQGSELEDVTYVITSGAMVNTRIADEIGGFREDFFIDYVDTEFCLRARQHKYRILVACGAILHHHFGDRRFIRWGPIEFYPSFHSSERWYTMSRNRIPMLLNYGFKFPHWLSYDIVATIYILVRMLLTETQRRAKLLKFFQGTWDGLRGRMGPPYWANS